MMAEGSGCWCYHSVCGLPERERRATGSLSVRGAAMLTGVADRGIMTGAMTTARLATGPLSSVEFIQQRSRHPEVRRIDIVVEPLDDWGECVPSVRDPALTLP